MAEEAGELDYRGAREKAFGEVGRYVGKALAQAVNLIFPEVILIDDLM